MLNHSSEPQFVLSNRVSFQVGTVRLPKVEQRRLVSLYHGISVAHQRMLVSGSTQYEEENS